MTWSRYSRRNFWLSLRCSIAKCVGKFYFWLHWIVRCIGLLSACSVVLDLYVMSNKSEKKAMSHCWTYEIIIIGCRVRLHSTKYLTKTLYLLASHQLCGSFSAVSEGSMISGKFLGAYSCWLPGDEEEMLRGCRKVSTNAEVVKDEWMDAAICVDTILFRQFCAVWTLARIHLDQHGDWVRWCCTLNSIS